MHHWSLRPTLGRPTEVCRLFQSCYVSHLEALCYISCKLPRGPQRSIPRLPLDVAGLGEGLGGRRRGWDCPLSLSYGLGWVLGGESPGWDFFWSPWYIVG